MSANSDKSAGSASKGRAEVVDGEGGGGGGEKPAEKNAYGDRSLESLEANILLPKVNIRDVQADVASLKDVLASCKDAVNGLETELARVKAGRAEDVKWFETQIREIHEKLAVQSHDSSLDVVSEVQDRLRRANNVMVFNVPDSTSETPIALYGTIRDLCAALMLPVDVCVNAMRMGYYREKPRPVLVMLKSPVHVHMIMNSKTMLRSVDRWRNVWIAEDMTTSQRFKMHAARHENKPRTNGTVVDCSAVQEQGQ